MKNFDSLADMDELQAIWLWGNPVQCSCETRKLLDKVINKNITLDSHYMDYRNRVFTKNFGKIKQGRINPLRQSSIELKI